jgi:hypothetical protein
VRERERERESEREREREREREATPLARSASERRGKSVKGLEKLYLKAKARICP